MKIKFEVYAEEMEKQVKRNLHIKKKEKRKSWNGGDFFDFDVIEVEENVADL